MDLYKRLNDGIEKIGFVTNMLDLTAERTEDEKLMSDLQGVLSHLRAGLLQLADAVAEMPVTELDPFALGLIDDEEDDEEEGEEDLVTIEYRSREEIEARVAALSPEAKKRDQELQAEFIRLTAAENPDHEAIGAVIRESNELTGLKTAFENDGN